MKQMLRYTLTTLLLVSSQVPADTLQVDAAESAQMATSTPARGMSMPEVKNRFGEAERQLPSVGEPPITRWVYSDFVVYFEHDRVIHSVMYSE